MTTEAKAGMGISTVVDYSFEEAIDRATARLKEEGFGVLTEIDVKATLKEKLGIEFRRYRILGACNPPFAHRALETDLQVGLAMPCNVVVYERDDGKTAVLGFDPQTMLAAFDHPAMATLAAELGAKMRRVIEGL